MADPYAAYTVQLCIDKAWAVTLVCRACHHSTSWRVVELAARFPPAATLGAICARARCTACDGDAIIPSLTQDHGVVTKARRAYDAELAEREAARAAGIARPDRYGPY